ncbi:MAG: DUF945 family protein [Sulfurovum sp.]|nr:DUF945 family protein [Sulfurovum sp.]MDD3601929.1 DUF945 family protein [Sulfurovum sp.]
MKKLLFGLAGIMIAALVYYVAAGSTQIADEIKKQVDTELAVLEKNGFDIENRTAKDNTEHLVIHFSDPEKIAHYLSTQGLRIDSENAKIFQGMKAGIDIHYLPDAANALSLEIYPLNLPQSITSGVYQEEDQKALQAVQNMIDKKVFLLHIDFEKLLSGFKGYVKDIHITPESNQHIELEIKGMVFEGNIEKEKIKTIAQKLESFSLRAADDFQIQLSNVKSTYMLTGPSLYDISTKYEIGQMLFDEKSGFSLHLDHFNTDSASWEKEDLLSSRMATKIETIAIDANHKKAKLEGVVYEANISNLNIPALEKLSQTSTGDQNETIILFGQMLSSNAALDISALHVAKIETDTKTMDGFTANARLSFNKNIDFQAWQTNPLALLGTINLQTNISISSELFMHLMEDPRAMVIPMLFPPKEENGKKIYDIRLHKGMLKINDVPLQ